MRLRLILLALFATSSQAFANIVASLDWMKPGMRWECPEFEFLGEYNFPTLMQQAETMPGGCDKAEIYHNVIYEVINGPHVTEGAVQSQTVQNIEREARYKMVISLATSNGRRKDDVEIVNQANRYLEKYGDEDPMAFAMHYYLLAAIQRTVRPSDRAQEQTFMAIGEHPRQREFLLRPQLNFVNGQFVITEVQVPSNHPEDSDRFSSKMYRMAYKSLIERYDGRVSTENQRLVNQVKQWQNEAKAIYANHFIERGDYYLAKNEPFAAAYWYTQLTKRPPFQNSNGTVIYQHYDRGAVRVAWSYLVAAQNFAGLRPDVNVRGRFLESALNEVLWGLGSSWIVRGEMDFNRWLQADPGTNTMSRAEMAELAFCSAESVYAAAANGRSVSQITGELAQLPSRLATQQAQIEGAIGRQIRCP
jgi:hypothetical protein